MFATDFSLDSLYLSYTLFAEPCDRGFLPNFRSKACQGILKFLNYYFSSKTEYFIDKINECSIQ